MHLWYLHGETLRNNESQEKCVMTHPPSSAYTSTPHCNLRITLTICHLGYGQKHTSSTLADGVGMVCSFMFYHDAFLCPLHLINNAGMQWQLLGFISRLGEQLLLTHC